MRKIFAAAIITSLLATNCGHAREVDDLRTRVASLQAEAAAISEALSLTCRMTMEGMSGGMIVYLGDDIWMNRLTGEFARITEVDKLCADARDEYAKAVETRTEERAVADKVLGDAPPIVED